MFADIVKDSQFYNKDIIYEKFLACETTVRTKPTDSLSEARSAAEQFVKAVLYEHGIVVPKNPITAHKEKLATADERLTRCFEEGFFDEEQFEYLTQIRKSGNKSVHDPAQKSNVQRAADLFEGLYKAIAGYIKKEKITSLSPLEEKYPLYELLPIGSYEVIKPLFSHFSWDIIPSYLCKKITKDGEVETVVIRRFRLEEKADVRHEREILASNTVRRNYTDVSYEPIRTEEIPSSPDCKHRYLCYILGKSTFLMNDTERLKGLNLSVYQKLNVLSEIAQTLDSLIDIENGVSIHHRQLSPKSIFIIKGKKNVHAKVGFFEYSKIDESDTEKQDTATVMRTEYYNKNREDYYRPPEFRDQTIRMHRNVDWEQIDVYSCAMICIYAFTLKVARSVEEEEAALRIIEESVSFELSNILEKILTMPYGSRPRIKELKKVLRMEALRYEE